MLLFSSLVLLVVFPAGVLATGLLTRTYSCYTTLVCGALFGLAISCMMWLVLWSAAPIVIEKPEASAIEHGWGYWIYQVVGTPVLASLSALVARIGANLFVSKK